MKNISVFVTIGVLLVGIAVIWRGQILARKFWICFLAKRYGEKYDRLGDLEDLDKAIKNWGQAISLAHKDAILPAHLGTSLLKRFQRLGELADLDKSINYLSQSILLTPQGHPGIPSRLSNLGMSFQMRFERSGDLADLDQLIDCFSQAVLLTPQEHSSMPSRLNNLGLSLHTRFEQRGEPADLHRSIDHLSQAVSLTLQGHPEMPARLSNLGVSLQTRFEQLGELADLEKAIEYKSQAISLSPQGHPEMPGWLSNLSVSLQTRFQQLGELADLDTAIDHLSRAVSLTPQGHPKLPGWLNNLGVSLHAQFQRLGELSDLDGSIGVLSHSISLTPQGHPEIPARLNNLGISLRTRFWRLGELADLDEAVEAANQAVFLTPQGHSSLPGRLYNLGISLQTRFERLGELADLEKAIKTHNQAVLLTPKSNSGMPGRLNTLGASLQMRFHGLGELIDLNKGIDHYNQAVLLTPQGHSDMPSRLNNLGNALKARFKLLGERADLDKAIEHLSQAAQLTPNGHPDMPLILGSLGNAYSIRSDIPGLVNDLELSLECLQSAAEYSPGSPFTKFNPALEWARLCDKHRPELSIAAYQLAMSLLAQLVWLGSPVNGRYRSIIDAGSVTTEAAAAAIRMKDYHLALEWLEEGRSIVWKQMLQLRTPMDDLAIAYPELASQLQEVSGKLEIASSPTPMQDYITTNTLSLEQVAQAHRRLAENWEVLITEARTLPGFESFLCPRKAIDLMQVAWSSSVVVINVHETRIDALVLQPGHKEISHIPLALSYEQVSRSRAQLGHFVGSRGPANRYPIFDGPPPEDVFQETLTALWIGIVKPVVDFLGCAIMSTGDVPRITWCTTGPLSFLPLHAAGDYESESRVFDYVVSSYTPTLSALLPPSAPATFSGLLAVGQKSTSGMPSLPGTDNELTRIQEKTQGQIVTRLDGDSATPAAVLNAIEKHSWVHLACHAKQNSSNPMQSAFYLHEGTLDLAAIAQKQLKHVELAFLSACQTATGDESLSDEAVHLAAGMLMAGYRTVIATMWSIGDEDAPLVAETVYEHIMEGGTPNARKAAVALHKATERLREKVGTKAFAKWVPYIHIGL